MNDLEARPLLLRLLGGQLPAFVDPALGFAVNLPVAVTCFVQALLVRSQRDDSLSE